MTVREKIGKYPIWKAALVFLFSFTVVIGICEKFIISRVFHLMDKTIAYFEAEKKQEMAEWEDDVKRAKEFDKKWQAGFDQVDKNFTHASKMIKQSKYCLQYLDIQEAREYLAKHKNDPKNLVQLSWEKSREEEQRREGKNEALIELENAIKNKEFDPSTCHKGHV